MADDAPTLELRIQDNSEKAISGILSLANSLSALKVQASNGLGLGKVIKQLETFNQKFQATFNTTAVENITKVADALGKLAVVREIKIPEISVGKIAKDASSSANIMSEDFGQGIVAQKTAEAADQMRDYSRTVEDAKADVGELKDNVAGVDTKMEEQARAATRATEEIKKHTLALKDLTDAGKRVISPLDKIIKSFNRILFYRVIRSVLKEIAKGFSEGLKNVRAYSKAISGSFDKAMTSAENTMFKLKNTLGAALAPALEAIIPWVQQLTNWFITLVNYVNQFIALITGKSQWTRATDASAASFEKTKKAAAGAAKEVKNLLAGFDELNIIQSESGGGGGGSAGKIEPDYTTAFEEVYKFDEKIKSIVNWLKENMDSIRQIALDLGALFLAWRVSNAFSGIIGKLGSLIVAGMVIKTVWDLESWFNDKYLETSEPGWLISNILTTALGATLAADALKKVLGKEGATIGAAITIAVSAAADINSFLQDFKINGVTQSGLVLAGAGVTKGGVIGFMVGKLLGLGTGGALLTGLGVAAATVGITAALAVTIDANKKNLKWGENELSDDMISEWVNQKMFSVDVPTTVNLIDTAIANADSAREELKGKATELFGQMNVLRLGVNVSETRSNILGTILNADGTNSLVQMIEKVINENKNVVNIGVTAVPFINELGEDASKEFAAGEMAGWDIVKEYIEGKGEELTKYLVPGTNQLKKDLQAFELDAVDAILGTFQRISAALSNSQIMSGALVDLNMSLSSMTEKSGKAVIEKYGEYRKQLYDAYLNAEYAKAGQAFDRYNVLQEMLKDAGLSDELRAEYEDEAKKAKDTYEYIFANAEKRALEQTEQAAKTGKKIIEDALTEIYANPLASIMENNNLLTQFETTLFNFTSGKYDVNEAVSDLSYYIKKTVSGILGMTEEEFNNSGIDVGSILSDSVKTSLLTNTYKTFGTDVAKGLAKQLGVELPPELENAIKLAFKETRLGKFPETSGNGHMFNGQVDDAKKTVEDIEEVFSSSFYEQSGVGVGGPIEQLSNWFDATVDYIKKESESTRNEVDSIWEEAVNNLNEYYGISTKADDVHGLEAEVELVNTLEDDYKALQRDIENQQKVVDNYKDAINSLWEIRMHPESYTPEQVEQASRLIYDESPFGIYAMYREQTAKLEEMQAEAQSLRELIETPIEAPTVETSSLTESVDNANKEVNSAVNSMIRDLNRLSSASVNINFDYSFWRGGAGGGNKWTSQMFRAGGGFVTSGDMFVARENGVNEYVGRIGNRTAVANNDQIVSGVASGVAAGQSEQNSLLRQQNDLLRQMLAKSGRVEAVPSADWGRFVKRSAEMYAYNTGM